MESLRVNLAAKFVGVGRRMPGIKGYVAPMCSSWVTPPFPVMQGPYLHKVNKYRSIDYMPFSNGDQCHELQHCCGANVNYSSAVGQTLRRLHHPPFCKMVGFVLVLILVLQCLFGRKDVDNEGAVGARDRCAKV